MDLQQTKDISWQGLWKNNPALVQLLGLCPLLAVTGTFVNALGLGIVTLLVLVASNSIVSLIRNHVSDAVRLPAFVMIIASVVTCAELLMQALTFELYQILGIFIPLIVTNCAILGRADAFARKHPLLPAALDGFAMGMGFLLVLLLLGGLRELFGAGTLFARMDLLFGPSAANWVIRPFGEHYQQVLFLVLPPGAFIVMGFIIAGKNVIEEQLTLRAQRRQADVVRGSKRVRVTGNVSKSDA